MRIPVSLLPLLVIGCSLFCSNPASAQLDVKITLERENFVSLETIEATVTVTNTVGKDVVLGGANGTTWLNFQIFDAGGVPANPIRPVPAQPIMLRNGESLKRKFELNRYFYLSESGTYIMRAAAYFPELEKHNQSRPIRFTVQQPRTPRWKEVFAVPGEGSYRRYEIFTLTDTKKSFVCLSVVDEATKMVMSRSALGSVMVEKDIQPAVDNNKHLHIIYLSTPTFYVYQQIDPNGNITQREYYLLSKGEPRLIKNSNGTIAISGGQVYDPSQQPADPGVRRLSDRPVGLPD